MSGRGCPHAHIDALADQNDLTIESYVDVDKGAIAVRATIIGGRLIRIYTLVLPLASQWHSMGSRPCIAADETFDP